MASYCVDKPAPDSHFRLLPCVRCKSEDVVYVQMSAEGKQKYRVRCRFCGNRTLIRDCKHDAQIEWNERRFALEDEGLLSPEDRVFRWEMLDMELNYRFF